MRQLATLDGPVTLSELVSRLHALGTRQEVLELLTLTVLRWYAPEDGERPSLSVMKQGSTFSVAGFFGDEMTIPPSEVSRAAVS